MLFLKNNRNYKNICFDMERQSKILIIKEFSNIRDKFLSKSAALSKETGKHSHIVDHYLSDIESVLNNVKEQKVLSCSIP